MPEREYRCRQCGEVLDISKGRKVIKFTEAAEDAIVIQCPKCGTENEFPVPANDHQ